MNLTTAQLVTLRDDIAADGVLSLIPHTPDGSVEVAAAYNLTASPDFWVWRTRVSKAEYVQDKDPDGGDFNWTGFINRSQGERDAWREMFDAEGYANPSLLNVRQAFQDIFSGGASPAPENRAHLASMSRRLATRGEQLFASGVGDTSSPATMGPEGTVTPQNVRDAWATP